MPGFIVHQGATALCSHGGQAMAISPDPRVRVSGQMVSVMSTLYSVAGFPFTTGASPQPCVTGQWLMGATRVRAGGQPVILFDSQSITIPNGTPMSVVSTQTRVRGQ